MSSRKLARLFSIVAVIAAALAGALTQLGGDGSDAPNTTVVHGVQLDAAGVSAYKRAARTDVADHGGLASETPPGYDQQQLEDSREASQEAARETTLGPHVVPESQTLASPEQRGCRTQLVGNRSSRNGARPALFVLHYTVSPNRAGWGDVNGIVAYFNSARSQASSTYVIDAEGHCKLIVPESQKPWTQGYFNPWSISVEVINTGREPSYAGRAGLRRLGQVVSDSTARWGIPLREGRTSGCRIVRSGVVDHDELGCGNNHTDIKPYSVGEVLAAARRARGAPGNRKLREWRRSHRIAHAKLRAFDRRHQELHDRLPDRCGGECARLRAENRSLHSRSRHYRARNRKLHRLIAREEGRGR